MLAEAISLLCVAFLWGSTNPLIKKNSKDIIKIEADSALVQFILELKYLFTNVNYLWPMFLNQLGSIVYFITLQSTDLSLSVPVANSLTFVFTALSGWWLGESFPRTKTIAGVVFIMVGATLCCFDKYLANNSAVGWYGSLHTPKQIRTALFPAFLSLSAYHSYGVYKNIYIYFTSSAIKSEETVVKHSINDIQ